MDSVWVLLGEADRIPFVTVFRTEAAALAERVNVAREVLAYRGLGVDEMSEAELLASAETLIEGFPTVSQERLYG